MEDSADEDLDPIGKPYDGTKSYVMHFEPRPEAVHRRKLVRLPAPPGKFIRMLRLYWPKETPPSIIDGSWKIPPVK
jgi:hypothetical protein